MVHMENTHSNSSVISIDEIEGSGLRVTEEVTKVKKLYAIVSLLAIILGVCCACSKEKAPLEMEDIWFDLPEGYSAIKSGDGYSFVYDLDSSTIGGIQVTQIPKRSLSKKGITKVMKYLQEEFHKTNNVEFIAFVGGGENPHIGVTLTRIDDITEEKRHFYHIFFERNACVYHAWFDSDVIGGEIKEQIISLIAG